MRIQDRRTRRRAPQEIVAREQTSRVLRVRHRDVGEDALHDDEDAGAVEDDADGGGDPGDVWSCGPLIEINLCSSFWDGKGDLQQR